MQFQWAMLYYSIVMRTITLYTIHVGALENYTKSNNMKVVNRTLMGNIEVMERRNVTVIFANIRTYYLLYDKSHSKTHSTIIPFSICYKFWLHQRKK